MSRKIGQFQNVNWNHLFLRRWKKGTKNEWKKERTKKEYKYTRVNKLRKDKEEWNAERKETVPLSVFLIFVTFSWIDVSKLFILQNFTWRRDILSVVWREAENFRDDVSILWSASLKRLWGVFKRRKSQWRGAGHAIKKKKICLPNESLEVEISSKKIVQLRRDERMSHKWNLP